MLNINKQVDSSAKKVLVIMPNTFEYPKIIKDELERIGMEVFLVNDRPNDTSFMKAISRVKRNVVAHTINKYFNQLLVSTSSVEFDYVFVILTQSFTFDKTKIMKLKESQKKARFVLYAWDAIDTLPYTCDFFDCFDRLMSFDPNDVKKYDRFIFLPLFYSRAYGEIGKTKSLNEYDVVFIGTAKPKKYKYITQMCEQLKPIYHKQFIYLFLPSRLVYIYNKLKYKSYKNAKYNEFRFKKLSEKNTVNIFKKSACILDCPQDYQVGLTMRVFECLGAKKKMITANSDIKNYDFYKAENIYIYDGKTFDFHSKFFQTKEYSDLGSDIYSKYSVNSWLKNVLDIN